MAAISRGSPHYQQTYILPVIQIGYTFVSTTRVHGRINRTILTLIDARSQLDTAIVVPQKGMRSYDTTQAKLFLYEVGRTNAILHTDDDTSIRAVAKELARQISGRSVRTAPTSSKESQGPIERCHQTLHDQVTALRL